MRIALAFLIAAPVVAAEPRVLVADPEPVVTVRIRASELPVRVALGVPPVLLLNAAPAIETGIRPFPVIGKLRFSNALLPGGSALVRFNRIGVGIEGAPKRKLPTAWIEPEVTARTAGVLSIFALEGDRIVWANPRAPAGGQTYALARDGTNDPDVMLRLGGEKIRLTLAPDSPVTIMNARAAAALEREGLVRRGNRVGLWEPIPRARLPWQALVPRPGATLAGLPLVRPAARVSEAEAKAIDARAEAGTSTEEDDADTILVRGEREGRRSRAPWVLVGADVLGSCSRIELDRPGKRWLLTCAF
ncbi:hypothetical protein [Thermaurantiacus tibetensis]|uniref:hypothetical protein n=1 Tax=Thermaurantiacus tibetensis TaxID=2759035 RepID=UPI00188E3F0F|nr:hypothetical protein [Thermaurantiacus tibetensis]